MAFPFIAAIGPVLEIGTKLAQGRVEDAFDSLNPFSTAGGPLEVTIPLGGQVQVEHKLGQVPQGYTINCKMGEGDVWDYQAPDDKYFYLETNAVADLVIKLTVT